MSIKSISSMDISMRNRRSRSTGIAIGNHVAVSDSMRTYFVFKKIKIGSMLKCAIMIESFQMPTNSPACLFLYILIRFSNISKIPNLFGSGSVFLLLHPCM